MIHKFVLTERDNGYCTVEEFVLRGRADFQKIGLELWAEGLYHEARYNFYHAEVTARSKPIWDFESSTTDWFFDLPLEVRTKILRQYGGIIPGTYYVCLY